VQHLALGIMIVLMGVLRLGAAAWLGSVPLRRMAWLWIAAGALTAAFPS
jgi:hypothetical protein